MQIVGGRDHTCSNTKNKDLTGQKLKQKCLEMISKR